MSELLQEMVKLHERLNLPDDLPKYLPLTIRKYPNEILKQVSTPAPLIEPTYELANLMVKAMDTYRGVGLAAVQVGLPIRLIVIRLASGGLIKMANPVIVESKGKPVLKEEGCLSFPKATALVKRNTTVICEYFNLDSGNTVRRTFTHRDAHVLQHEIDHLNGITTPDRLDKLMAKKFISDVLKSNTSITSEMLK